MNEFINKPSQQTPARQDELNLMDEVIHLKGVEETKFFTNSSSPGVSFMDNTVITSARKIEVNTPAHARILRSARTMAAKRKYNDELQHLVEKDSLTKLDNHRAILEKLYAELENAARERKEIVKRHKTHVKNPQVACVMLDIDLFKQVNDTYGHQTGDRVLIGLSRVLQRNERPRDAAGRYGGEEFLIVIPGMNEKQLKIFLSRINNEIKHKRFKTSTGEYISITVSMGATISIESNDKLHEIVSLADKALYHAKNKGRNCGYLLNDKDSVPKKINYTNNHRNRNSRK